MVFWRRKKKQRRNVENETSILRHVLYGILSILIVVLVCALVWYLTRVSSVTISDVRVSGGETISHEMIHGVVEQELVGAYYLLVPKRFVYTYPHDRIIEVLDEVPRLYNAEVTIEDTVLEVTFKEYVPHALWCQSEAESASCYFVSEDGYAFSPAPPLRGGALTRHVWDDDRPLERRQLFDDGSLQDIDTFIDILDSQLSFRVHSVLHTAEEDIVYHVNGGGDLLVAASSDPEETLRNLKSILESDEFQHLAPGNFNYIDLRFGNKVFVNEGMEQATSTETGEE